MLTACHPARQLGFALVVALGIVSILGSESVEKDDGPPVPPVTTQFVIGSRPAPLVVDRGAIEVTLTGLRLSGDYEAAAGDRLTLDREFVTLDTDSAFTVEATPAEAADPRVGTVTLSVSSRLDYAPGRNPQAGQLATLFAATTTIVRASADLTGAGITVGGGTETVMSWQDFRDAENDSNDALDIRMASLAYNRVADIYRTAIRAETAALDIDGRHTGLEGVGLGVAVEVDCDAVTGTDTGSRALTWKTDAPGTGEGTVGNGDGFEIQYANCRNDARAETLQGILKFSNYLLDNDGDKTLGMNIELAALFRSTTTIGTFPQPALAVPRYTGELRLDYTQLPAQ